MGKDGLGQEEGKDDQIISTSSVSGAPAWLPVSTAAPTLRLTSWVDVERAPAWGGVASDRAADSTLPAPPYLTLVLGVSVGRDQRSGHLVIVSRKLQPRVSLRFFFLITFCNQRITNGNYFLKIHESLLAKLLALFPSHLQTMTMSCSSL